MRYDRFSYIIPPRAEKSICRSLISIIQQKGWIAQVKKNGTNSVIFVPPNRKPIAYNRHGEMHRTWKFTPESAALFTVIPGHNWWAFNAELLHAKVNGGPKDTNFVHDVLVADGEYLLGERYADRYGLMVETLVNARLRLTGELPALQPHTGYMQVTPKTWVADIFKPSLDYTDIYDNLTDLADEGLMLKDPQAKLGTRDGSGANWMVKIRRQTKNYGF